MRRPHCGFSLVELVLVVALLAVLLSLAAPSWQAYWQRAHRVQAMAELLSAAQCQERLRTALGSYVSGHCLPTGNERYRYAWRAGPNAAGFEIAARPQSAQMADDCGELTLDHRGTRRVGGRVNAARCWAGR